MSDAGDDGAWEAMAKRWAKWPRDKRGTPVAPADDPTPSSLELLAWLGEQRQLYRNGELRVERIAWMEEAGMVWNTRAIAWEEGFYHFMLLKPNAHGMRVLSRRHVTGDEFRLGAWQSYQRTAYNSGTLTPTQRYALETAGMVWSPKDASWDEGVLHFEQVTKK